MEPQGNLFCNAAWARVLTPDQFQRVVGETREKTYAAGAVVCRRGDPADAWIGVIDGLIKGHLVTPDGRPITLTGVPSGGWFGEGSLLKNEPRRYDVLALRPSRIAFVPRATFEWLLDTSIPFNRFVMRQINERLGQFIALVAYDRMLDTDARVARCLGELYHPILHPDLGQKLSISQEEIGLLTGISRQRANQALQKLEHEGLLTLEYGGVRVLDVERLRKYGA
jgi:CRP/FNR family transcriptional regulator, cyclic AMP receptor protein